jgi:hypothetical protein
MDVGTPVLVFLDLRVVMAADGAIHMPDGFFF